MVIQRLEEVCISSFKKNPQNWTLLLKMFQCTSTHLFLWGFYFLFLLSQLVTITLSKDSWLEMSLFLLFISSVQDILILHYFIESYLQTTSIFWIVSDRLHHLIHDPNIVYLIGSPVLHNHYWVTGPGGKKGSGEVLSHTSQETAGTQPLTSYFCYFCGFFKDSISKSFIFLHFTLINIVYYS